MSSEPSHCSAEVVVVKQSSSSSQNQTDLHYNFFLNQEQGQDVSDKLPDIDMTPDQAFIHQSPQLQSSRTPFA